jgi:simple sugar transport system ATP-binding protein
MPFYVPELSEYPSYAVVMKEIVKQFPSVLANDHVDLYIKEQEIHAIVGENGAGKSTLMNLLYGLYTADSGRIYIHGEEKTIRGPSEAIHSGIGMVHQHFMLIGPLTVAENIVLGEEPLTKRRFFDLKTARKMVRELSETYGLHVDVDAKIEDIPVGTQQRVEILKTLYRGAKILILDEPTAVLTPQETEELFVVLRKLREKGKTIIFITHKLHEVMAISDNVTVMRLGKVTGRLPIRETSPRQLANMMVGREVLLRVEKTKKEPGKTILQIDDLWVKDNRGLPAVKGVGLTVREGEIIGIAGVAGNGQTELIEAIAGLRKKDKGKIELCEKDITHALPRDIRELGLSHIAENRYKHGMIKDFPVYYNIILGRHYLPPFSRNGFLNHRKIFERAKYLIKKFDVRPQSIMMLAENLSGGNQQKMVVGREIDYNPKCMLVAQPTRGLDIGAIEYIHQTLLYLRETGVAILLVSMELEEIFSLSDRILVMYEGRFMGETTPGAVSLEEIGLAMAGTPLEEVRAAEAATRKESERHDKAVHPEELL